MVDFNSVLEDARQLSPSDQAKLIDALWDTVPVDADIPLHPEWAAELERRVNELKVGAEAGDAAEVARRLDDLIAGREPPVAAPLARHNPARNNVPHNQRGFRQCLRRSPLSTTTATS